MEDTHGGVHESGDSFISSSFIRPDDGAFNIHINVWSVGCGTPLMTQPLGAFSSFCMTADSDLSCVALYDRAQDEVTVKLKVWK